MLAFYPSLVYRLLTLPAESSRSGGTNIKGKETCCLVAPAPRFHIFKFSKVNKQQKVNNLINFPFILMVKFPSSVCKFI